MSTPIKPNQKIPNILPPLNDFYQKILRQYPGILKLILKFL